MVKKIDSTGYIANSLNSKNDRVYQNNHTHENPEKYNISVDAGELNDINTLISELPNITIARKNAVYFNLSNPKYTLLKTDSGYYLIGDGRKDDLKNAYLGSGTNMGSTVKVCVKLTEKDGKYQLSDEIYVVKKYNQVMADMNKEVSLIKKAYGFGEIIFDNEKGKTYVIMTKIPGLELKKLDYTNMDENELKNIIVNVIQSLIEIHQKGILHNDVNPLNIFYDKESKSVHFTDFGSSSEGSNNSRDESYHSDFEGLKFTLLEVIADYLEKHPTSLDLNAADAKYLDEERAASISENLINSLLSELKANNHSDINKMLRQKLDQEFAALSLEPQVDTNIVTSKP